MLKFDIEYVDDTAENIISALFYNCISSELVKLRGVRKNRDILKISINTPHGVVKIERCRTLNKNVDLLIMKLESTLQINIFVDINDTDRLFCWLEDIIKDTITDEKRVMCECESITKK